MKRLLACALAGALLAACALGGWREPPEDSVIAELVGDAFEGPDAEGPRDAAPFVGRGQPELSVAAVRVVRGAFDGESGYYRAAVEAEMRLRGVAGQTGQTARIVPLLLVLRHAASGWRIVNIAILPTREIVEI